MKNRKHIQSTIEEFLMSVDHVHLSLDLAVFPSAVAEGVNMSRTFGGKCFCCRNGIKADSS